LFQAGFYDGDGFVVTVGCGFFEQAEASPLHLFELSTFDPVALYFHKGNFCA